MNRFRREYIKRQAVWSFIQSAHQLVRIFTLYSLLFTLYSLLFTIYSLLFTPSILSKNPLEIALYIRTSLLFSIYKKNIKISVRAARHRFGLNPSLLLQARLGNNRIVYVSPPYGGSGFRKTICRFTIKN
jgi:hypothetical protein